MNVDPTGLFSMLNDLAMSNVWVNNLDNMNWLNRQQASFERVSANIGKGLSYYGTGMNDFISYSVSYEALSARNIRVGGYLSNRIQPIVTRQSFAEDLQTGGDVLTALGVGCGFTVVCAPTAPALVAIGGGVNLIGTALDTELSGLQKGISIAGGRLAGQRMTKEFLDGGFSKPVSNAAGEALGYGVGGLPASYNETCKNIHPPYKC
ncbi:hypothetical protein [Acinetobacter populi]|nr:hypothetical protein [Acinetobacter populi]